MGKSLVNNTNKLPESSGAKSVSYKLRLVILSLATLVTLLGLEIAIRIWDAARGKGFFSTYRNRLAKPIQPRFPFRSFGFVPYMKRDGITYIASRHKELYPLEKPSGTFRIVVFGGSTTANLQAVNADSPHYPLLLQTKLRHALARDDIEVINVGNPSYATPHSLILLTLDVLSWQPDLVILSHNINDLTALYWSLDDQAFLP